MCSKTHSNSGEKQDLHLLHTLVTLMSFSEMFLRDNSLQKHITVQKQKQPLGLLYVQNKQPI